MSKLAHRFDCLRLSKQFSLLQVPDSFDSIAQLAQCLGILL